MPKKRLTIIMPIFNDWESFFSLIQNINRLSLNSDYLISILGVDDCSTEAPNIPKDLNNANFHKIEVIKLISNLGHQRALCIGSCYVVKNSSCDLILLMDSDGEDQPSDISKLLKSHLNTPNSIIVAQRMRRNEALSFKVGYAIFKLLFRITSGKKINFGNFCLMSAQHAKQICSMQESWNHLAATILRSRISYKQIPIDRGTRLFGKSSMNLESLVMHGLGAISVFLDIFLTRMLFVILLLIGLLIILGIIIVLTKYLSHAIIPGWTTTALGFVAVLLVQSAILAIITLFITLSQRSIRTIIPIKSYNLFVESNLSIKNANQL